MADPATLLSLALLLAPATAQITVFDSINQCCSLGSYRAKAQLDQTCDDISVPVKDIIPEMQVVLETKVIRMFPKISQSRRRPLLGPSPG